MGSPAASPEVRASLRHERARRRSAEEEHNDHEAMERALKNELERVQEDIDEQEYRALIDDMDGADALEACAEAGIDAQGVSALRARSLLLAHLCGRPAAVQPHFVAADDDDSSDDDDDESEEEEDSDDGWSDAEEEAQAEEEAEEEALRLQALELELERVEGFRDEMEELTPPSSEGEAGEQVDALEELDAEIAALQERLRGWGGGRSQPAAGCEQQEQASDEAVGTGDGGSSSAALLAAAGLELSPGGSSYTIIGRQRLPPPASPEVAAPPLPPPRPSPRLPPAAARSPASWSALATSSPARVPPALPPASADWLDSGSDSDDSGDEEDDSLTADLQEEQESDEMENEAAEESGGGISAVDVELYLSLIAEADEEDLRAILQDEGLALSATEQREGLEAANLLRSRLRPHFAQKFGVCSALEPRFPLKVLQTSAPSGVKVHEKERHLLENEFEAVFGVGRTTFAAMPKWRQQRHKRDASLF